MSSILFLQGTTLMQSIQMKLSNKQNSFSPLLFAFLEFRLNIKRCEKKMTLIADIFRNCRLQKMWLDKCLESFVSENSLTGNIVNKPKHSKSEGHHLYHL